MRRKRGRGSGRECDGIGCVLASDALICDWVRRDESGERARGASRWRASRNLRKQGVWREVLLVRSRGDCAGRFANQSRRRRSGEREVESWLVVRSGCLVPRSRVLRSLAQELATATSPRGSPLPLSEPSTTSSKPRQLAPVEPCEAPLNAGKVRSPRAVSARTCRCCAPACSVRRGTEKGESKRRGKIRPSCWSWLSRAISSEGGRI